jgi:hypothetical protein
MRRLLRAFLMGMLMLAVPLQGIAATTMLLCGPGHGGASHASAEPAMHAHGAHHDADAADETSGLEAKGKCSACASCCSAVALLACRRFRRQNRPPARVRQSNRGSKASSPTD